MTQKKYVGLEGLQTFKTNADNLYATKTSMDTLSADVAYINIEDNETVTDIEVSSVVNAVLYTTQSLSDEQKTQARENIGAASSEYVVNVFEELKMLIQAGNTSEAIAVLDEAILDMAKLA